MSNSAEALRPKRAYGLEWLPVEGTNPCSARPLVVILPWMWAARSAIGKQVALYHSLGCDVAVYSCWRALAVWIPVLANRYAVALLAGLAAHLTECPREVVLACFSGAAKGVLHPLLLRLASVPSPSTPSDSPSTSSGEPCPSSSSSAQGHPRPQPQPHLQPLRRLSKPLQQPNHPQDPPACLFLSHLRGVIFDSGPVDFDSSIGVRLFTNSSNPWLRRLQTAAGSAAAGLLDFCLFEAFEAQRKAMWQGLRDSLRGLLLPVLFLYSWSGDALADPQPIHALASAVRLEQQDARGLDGSTQGGGQGGQDGAGRNDAGAGATVHLGGADRGRRGSSCRKPVERGNPPSEAPCMAGAPAAVPLVARAARPPPVREQAWDSSGHVAHLREHPLEYREAVAAFLDLCLGGRGTPRDDVRAGERMLESPGGCSSFHDWAGRGA